ncbi:DNA-protecting protein DprA [bacterium]|nr:DNA-protecting protein DprA [bacterium]
MSPTELTADSKAILLMSGNFGGKNRDSEVKPLTISEYNKVIALLVSKQFRPQDILDPELLLELKNDLDISVGYLRISNLLKRGASLAFAIENWMNKGIWIVTRNDQNYPNSLKIRFGNYCPPILFGSGDLSLFNTEGLAVVGSRNVDDEGEKFTAEISRFCAENGISIVSGGARGVDQVSMLASLDAYGTAIGVLADGLMRSSVSGKYREAIMDQRLLLISPYNPDARFNVGNAMGRNKYIYALSNYALVISAEKEKGGTWAGATEEIKHEKGVPVCARAEGNVPEGNHELMKMGAQPFPERPWDKTLFETLKNTKVSKIKKVEQTSIFDQQEPDSSE